MKLSKNFLETNPISTDIETYKFHLCFTVTVSGIQKGRNWPLWLLQGRQLRRPETSERSKTPKRKLQYSIRVIHYYQNHRIKQLDIFSRFKMSKTIMLPPEMCPMCLRTSSFSTRPPLPVADTFERSTWTASLIKTQCTKVAQPKKRPRISQILTLFSMATLLTAGVASTFPSPAAWTGSSEPSLAADAAGAAASEIFFVAILWSTFPHFTPSAPMGNHSH